jgi:hypothetical protein
MVFMVVEVLGSSLLAVVQVVGMVSLVVFSLLGVLHLVLNTMVGGVVALSWRGATVHGLPFVAFVLLQLDMDGSLIVVLVVVSMVVAVISVMIWFVLTPLWSKWLGTGFTHLVLTPGLSRVLPHVPIF